jgi:hypothetical protein
MVRYSVAFSTTTSRSTLTTSPTSGRSGCCFHRRKHR